MKNGRKNQPFCMVSLKCTKENGRKRMEKGRKITENLKILHLYPRKTNRKENLYLKIF